MLTPYTVGGKTFDAIPYTGCSACAFTTIRTGHADYRCSEAPCRAADRPDGISVHFVERKPSVHPWIAANYELYSRFCEEANKLRTQGRKRYSARTIGEFLRHETALRDVGDTFKLNNNRIPLMARQYMADYNCAGFFETREQA